MLRAAAGGHGEQHCAHEGDDHAHAALLLILAIVARPAPERQPGRGHLLQIQDDGNLEVQVTYSVEGPDSGAFWFGLLYSPIEAGGLGSIDAFFGPREARAYSTSIVIHTDDPDQPELWVDVLGTGVAPTLSIDPGEDYTFPDTPVGSSSGPVVFTVTNVGTTAVPLNVDVTGGGYDVDWRDVPGTPSESASNVLDVGQSKSFAVTFNPGDSGPHDTTLYLLVDSVDDSRTPVLLVYVHGLGVGGPHGGPGVATACGCVAPTGGGGTPAALVLLALLGWHARRRRR